MSILVLNAGSSTLKAALFDNLKPVWIKTWKWDKKIPYDQQINSYIAPLFKEGSGIKMVGHRVVHGGSRFEKPVIVDEKVKEAIAEFGVIAPLHNPLNLLGINAVSELAPHIPQVAVFDTAFHHTMPMKVKTYPLPKEWREVGIAKFGFHGISHQYCVERGAKILGKDLKNLKMISCHLGNGASLAAVVGGKSINTTMGFTPLEGLMMGTRSGSIDPGIFLYLQRVKKVTEEEFDKKLNNESGVKGIAGSGDMRELLEKIGKGDSIATLALEMYIERLKQYFGAMLVSMGGVDALLFTGGVGENVPEVRIGLCSALNFLGVRLNPDIDKGNEDRIISHRDSSIPVLVIHAREEYAIAKQCVDFFH